MASQVMQQLRGLEELGCGRADYPALSAETLPVSLHQWLSTTRWQDCKHSPHCNAVRGCVKGTAGGEDGIWCITGAIQRGAFLGIRGACTSETVQLPETYFRFTLPECQGV
jgi:hypothetical protein